MVNSLISRPTMLSSPAGEMDTIFNRLIRRGRPVADMEGALLTWPRMDVCETEDGYLLEMGRPASRWATFKSRSPAMSWWLPARESGRSPATSVTCVLSATSVNFRSHPADHPASSKTRLKLITRRVRASHHGPQGLAHAKPRKVPVKS